MYTTEQLNAMSPEELAEAKKKMEKAILKKIAMQIGIKVGITVAAHVLVKIIVDQYEKKMAGKEETHEEN